jgi:hypothetical protein
MTAENTWPLIYCNGDSYSDQNYHPSLFHNTYADVISRHFNGFVINRARSGSCNRRIIRTSVHDLLLQRQLNPEQDIICLMGLSFELRSEIWIDGHARVVPEESNFRTHTFTSQPDWRHRLINDDMELSKNSYGLDQKFFDMYTKGRAYFYSPYAERINLLCDLVMMKSLLEKLKIKFLIFQSPPAEKLATEYLLDKFREEISNDQRFFDFEEFSFVQWCHESGFQALDPKEPPAIAHYGADAHRAFAEQILLPKLMLL